MSATTTSPARKRPGATSTPIFGAPAISPVEAFTPEGRSTATIGFPELFIAAIARAASSRGSPWNPVPKSASMTTSASSTGASSDVRAALPAASSTSRAIRPSPPFAPPPHTATNRCASGKRSIASSATARPARAINSSTSWPASARFISSAV